MDLNDIAHSVHFAVLSINCISRPGPLWPIEFSAQPFEQLYPQACHWLFCSAWAIFQLIPGPFWWLHCWNSGDYTLAGFLWPLSKIKSSRPDQQSLWMDWNNTTSVNQSANQSFITHCHWSVAISGQVLLTGSAECGTENLADEKLHWTMDRRKWLHFSSRASYWWWRWWWWSV